MTSSPTGRQRKNVAAGLTPAIAALLVAATGAACQKPAAPARQPLERVYRAEHAMRAGVDVGLSFQRHGELLQELAAESAIASERAATDDQKRVAQAYADALAVYKDAQALWKTQIDSAEYVQQVGQGNILANRELAQTAAKYGVKPMEGKQLPDGWVAIAPDAMQTVWKAAAEKGRAAASQFGALK